MGPSFSRICASLLTAVVLCGAALAREIVLPPTLTIDGVSYTDVVYTGHDASRVKFRHASGIGSIPIRDLPENLRKELGYDPKAAFAAEEAAAAARKASAEENIRLMALAAARRKQQAFDEKVEQAGRVIVATIVRVLPDGALIEARAQTLGTVEQTVDAGQMLHPGATKTVRVPGLVDIVLSDNPDGFVFLHAAPGNLVDGGSWRGTAYAVGTTTYRDEDGASHTVPKLTDSKEEAAAFLAKQQP
jgi:hypothetical protein